jgi:hypothetical protein
MLMATCNDLNDQIKRLQEEQEADRSLIRAAEAAHAHADPVTSTRTRILRTYTGQAVEFNPDEWARQVEIDAMRMGDEAVQEMVRAAMTTGRTPNGRTGRMVNYRQIAPEDENIAALLEVMGFQRAGTEQGIELRRTFTQSVAANALMAAAKQAGSDPLAMANFLQKRVKGIDKLPSTVFILAKSKWDAASQYAQVLDDLADAMEGGYLTEAMKVEAGNVARWAHFFEQMDAQVRRRVGQALRTMQFGQDPSVNLLNLQAEVKTMTLADVQGDSMVADMLRLMKEGKSAQLRRMAAAKRADMALGINTPGWRRDLSLLNSLRRANMLSGIATWAVRNPVSAALVQGVYMAEDTVSGTMRMIDRHGLPQGTQDGLRAAGFAARGWTSAFSMAWGNMQTSLSHGLSTFGDDGLKYVESAGELQDARSIVMESSAFTQAWDDVTSWKGLANPISVLKLLNGSMWHVFGGAIERMTGSDIGYLAPFRILNATDEFMKTQAYVWKTNHEAFLQAAEEGRRAGMSIEWIEARANQMAEETIFSGVFTDDQLAEFRRARNSEYGMPLGDEIDNDELRLMLYNQMHGVPNTQTILGQGGMRRASDVTFTGDFEGGIAPILNGVNQMRQNPFFGWAMPFWRVPINGIGWVLNRDIFTGTARWLVQEGQQLASKAGGGELRYTPEQMYDARARTIVAATIAATTYTLWENGLFTDGGSFDPRQRERERRNWIPYAFSLPASAGMAALTKYKANGVDLFDLMGLQADIARAFHDGILSSNDAAEWNKPIVAAYASLLKNKAALLNITTLLNYAQDPGRQDFNRVVAGQLGGLLPLSGFGGNFTRGFSDPETHLAKRRVLSAEEMAAIGKDPTWKLIRPVVEGLQLVAEGFVRANSPNFNFGLLPREKDWLGNRIERPLGLPLDMAIPFMPVIKPEDPVFRWLEKHGFADKPHPDGAVVIQAGPEKAKLQMTNEEEDFYREQMRTVRGGTPPEALGVSPGRLMPIAPIVQGRTLYEALNELRTNPDYNRLLNTPAGGISPSLTVHPGQPLSKRKDAGGKELYYPIDDIIEYYDKAAQLALIGNSKFQFKERFIGLVQRQHQRLQQYLEGLTPLGVGRQ